MSTKKNLITNVSVTPLVFVNETQVIFQRHCDYDRINGGLIDNSVQVQTELAKKFMQNLFVGLTLDEIKNISILFVASNTVSNGNFKRCVETINIVMNVAKVYFRELGISEEQIINLSEKSNYKNELKEVSHIEEPRMFTDNKGYLEFLEKKHDSKINDFWTDFEEDNEKVKREELGAEGPDEIVDRGLYFLKILQRYSRVFHKKHPDSRLIVWCGTHYDLISPLVKKTILGYDKTDYVGVDYCGGISFVISENSDIIANLNGVNHPIDLQDKKQHPRHF